VDRTDSSAAKNDDVVSDTSRLVDVRESGRELVSSERVWSGPIFAVDADHVRLGPGQEPVALHASCLGTGATAALGRGSVRCGVGSGRQLLPFGP